jgi:hypothetical protein
LNVVSAARHIELNGDRLPPHSAQVSEMTYALMIYVLGHSVRLERGLSLEECQARIAYYQVHGVPRKGGTVVCVREPQ